MLPKKRAFGHRCLWFWRHFDRFLVLTHYVITLTSLFNSSPVSATLSLPAASFRQHRNQTTRWLSVTREKLLQIPSLGEPDSLRNLHL
jgi:hypothetical protein